MPSVGEFVKQLGASDRFLKSISTLPTFGQIHGLQLQKLQTLVLNSKYNEDDAATAAQKVSEAMFLSAEARADLMEKVAQACCKMPEKNRDGGKSLKGPSCQAQNYSTIHRFLPRTVWVKMENPKILSRVQALCEFAANLGLELPTEATLASMLCCIYWKEWCHGDTPKQEQYQIGQASKKQLREVLKDCCGRQQQKGNRLEKLPLCFEDLPGSHKKIFEEEPPAPASINLEECIKEFPMRSTRGGVHVKNMPQDTLQMILKMVSQQQSGGSSRGASFRPDLLAIEDGSAGASPASVSMVSGRETPRTQADASEAETINDSFGSQSQVQIMTSDLREKALKSSVVPKQGLAGTLAVLKDAYAKDNASRQSKRDAQLLEDAEPPQKKKKKKEQKQEAPVEKIQEKNVEKPKPTMPKATPKSKSKHKEEKKEKPSTTLKMDKKNVASRAYHHCLACKLREGMEKSDAKVCARLAHKHAGEQWEKEFGAKEPEKMC